MLTLTLLGLLTTNANAGLPLNQLPAPGVYVNQDGGPLLPLLENAREKIDIEIYTMKDLRVRQLLRAALKRGVKVRIVKDPNPLGEKCDVFGKTDAVSEGTDPSDNAANDCADQQKLVADVRAAGGSYVPFDKRALCPNGGGVNGQGCYEHGKIVIIDDRAMLSSGNFDSTNLCISAENPRVCDRDYSLVFNDRDVMDSMQRIFEADLAGARYDVSSMIPPGLADRFTVSPISLKPIVALIDSARSTLDVETQYLKNQDLNDAILRAARRGVKVTVTTASACSFGKPSQSEARDITEIYSAFDAAGVSSRMFTAATLVNGRAGYLHAKAIVVDGARAWVGSENGSTESLTQNREYGLVFDTAADVQALSAQLRADHSDSGDESWQESLECRNDRGGGAVRPQLPLEPLKPVVHKRRGKRKV